MTIAGFDFQMLGLPEPTGGEGITTSLRATSRSQGQKRMEIAKGCLGALYKGFSSGRFEEVWKPMDLIGIGLNG